MRALNTLNFRSFSVGCQVDLKLKNIQIRQHSKNNPPVLHRKELLVHPNHPDRAKFLSLTAQLEDLGAFKNIVKLGDETSLGR